MVASDRIEPGRDNPGAQHHGGLARVDRDELREAEHISERINDKAREAKPTVLQPTPCRT